jgi:hypothetical protein
MIWKIKPSCKRVSCLVCFWLTKGSLCFCSLLRFGKKRQASETRAMEERKKGAIAAVGVEANDEEGEKCLRDETSFDKA